MNNYDWWNAGKKANQSAKAVDLLRAYDEQHEMGV
jgi:hypothetical protein